MTIADVLRQFSYWRRRPPAGDLISIIAQFLGWKPPQPETSQADFAEAAKENAEWFRSPERFFAPGFGKKVKQDG